VLLLPNEGGSLASEVYKWVYDGRVVFDPYPHITGKAKEGAYIGEVPTFMPVMDFGGFQVVRDMAFVVALVSKDYDFRDSNEEFLCQDSGISAAKAVEDMVDVVEMLPDEAAHLHIAWDRFEPSIVCFVAGLSSFDSTIIHKRPCDVWDLRL